MGSGDGILGWNHGMVSWDGFLGCVVSRGVVSIGVVNQCLKVWGEEEGGNQRRWHRPENGKEDCDSAVFVDHTTLNVRCQHTPLSNSCVMSQPSILSSSQAVSHLSLRFICTSSYPSLCPLLPPRCPLLPPLSSSILPSPSFLPHFSFTHLLPLTAFHPSCSCVRFATSAKYHREVLAPQP